MKRRPRLWLLILAVWLLVASGGILIVLAVLTREPPPLEELPWHLAVVHWDVGPRSDCRSISVDVSIESSVPDESNLFVVPVDGHFNNHQFYAGLMSNLFTKRADGYNVVDLGKGAAFNRWDDQSRDSIRAAENGYAMVASNEGEFISARTEFHWDKGVYTVKLVRTERERIGEKTYCWVKMFVQVHETDREVEIGALRFPSDRLQFDGHLMSFVEVYNRNRTAAMRIRPNRIAVGNIRMDDEPVTPRSVWAAFEAGVPDSTVVKRVISAEERQSGYLQHFRGHEPVISVESQDRAATPRFERARHLYP